MIYLGILANISKTYSFANKVVPQSDVIEIRRDIN